MCAKCDGKVTAKPWKVWVGVGITLIIFTLSQVFMYGKVIGTFESHIKNDLTPKEMSDQYVSKDRFNSLESMVKYLYEKEGGK